MSGVLGRLLPLFGLDVLTAVTVGMMPPLSASPGRRLALPTVEPGLVNTV